MHHPSFDFPSHWIPLLECGLLALGLILLLLVSRRSGALAGQSIGERASGSRLLHFGVSRWALVWFLVGVASTAAITAVMGFPVPHHSDSAAYMFAAETMAAGRITSEASPHRALVPDHVVSDPLVSKYPPALGFVLALGIRLGHAGIGLWLLAGGIVAAAMWCFDGWMPRRWALLGVLLIGLRLAVGSYWNHSYWGGSVAAIGSLLLFGAIGWLRTKPATWMPLLAFGGGLIILAHSRPFEGLIAALPVMAWMVFRYLPRLAASDRKAWFRSCALLLVLGGAGVSSILLYNLGSTGDPFLFAHQNYKNESGMPPEFLWEKRIVPPLAGASQAEVEAAGLTRVRPVGWVQIALRSGLQRSNLTLFFILGPPLTLVLFLGIASQAYLRVKGEELQFPHPQQTGLDGLLITSCLLVFFASGFVFGYSPHYIAPITAPLWLLALRSLVRLDGLARLRSDVPGLRPLAGMATLALVIQAFSFVVQLPALRQDADSPRIQQYQAHDSLLAAGGRHLVLVAPLDAGLLNSPDLALAPVLWARDEDPASTVALLDAYPDRQLWFYDPFADPSLFPLDPDALRGALTSGQVPARRGVR